MVCFSFFLTKYILGSVVSLGLQFTGCRLESYLGTRHYTCVPLSPSSLTLYWSKGSDTLRQER